MLAASGLLKRDLSNDRADALLGASEQGLAAATSTRPFINSASLGRTSPHNDQDLHQNAQHPQNTMSNWTDDAANWTGREVRLLPLPISLAQI